MLKILLLAIGLGLASAKILGEGKCEIDKDFKILQKIADLETRIKTMEGSKPSCPNGWITFKGKCFLFEDKLQMTWMKAKDFCTSHEGTLAIIDTKEKDDFIADFVKRLFKEDVGGNTGFWFGAEDFKSTGVWEWYTTGIKLRDSYDNWISGEGDKGSMNDEHCGCLWKLSFPGFHQWHDCDCMIMNYVICERKMKF